MPMKPNATTQNPARPPEQIGQELVPVGELRPHEQTALVPTMDDRSFRAFRDDIERRGLLVPLDITRDGVVLDGVARLRAARDLGIASVPVRVVEPDDDVEY